MKESLSVPDRNQLRFQNWEMGLFLHFGIRTFYEGHTDWDGKKMPADVFNPERLDCEQWISTAKKAGINYTVFVCKHHDGFANWPSKYTDYSVAATPWKNGKGDVVREYTDACHKFNMGVGLYYSPADAGSLKSKKTGKEYDDYFINQISELLTGYGKIDVLWFDGCGSEGHTYDWNRIIGEIKKMQPDILIFNMGKPDIRWVGNESGLSPQACENVVCETPFSIQTDKNTELGENRWLPVECNCRMREINWFYSENDTKTVKSVDELMGIYNYSVGRGANLLINIGPDRNGLLPEPDSRSLLAFGEEVRREFSTPIAKICDFEKSSNDFVYKSASGQRLFNHVILEENIANGQKVEKFIIKVKPYPYGDYVTVYEGHRIGHKSICRFPTVRTEEIHISFETNGDDADIKDVSLYYVQ